MRALLRHADDRSRRQALDLIDGWGNRPPSAEAASALLRAASLAYPWVRTQRADPALLLARFLCSSPRSVAVADVEAAYLVSAERVRRVLLHLLALRRDGTGVASLAFLIGPDGPVDLLPLPTGGLLSPVLDVVSAPDLVPALLHVASRPGWAWHSAEILEQLVSDERLDPAGTARVVEGLAPVVGELVDACDRAQVIEQNQLAGVGGSLDVPAVPVARTSPASPPVSHAAGGAAKDTTRADRFRLRSLVKLYRVLPPDGAAPVLRRVLSSADSRVAATGATALVAIDRAVAPERFDLVARDPEARAELIDGLTELGRLEQLAPGWRDGRSRAEAELVRWLAADTELGMRPDEIEHLAAVPTGEHPEDGAVHLFRFRLRAPHWSSARGWMVGAAGPFHDDGGTAGEYDRFASSIYSAEDEDDLDGHLDAILDSLGVWPEADEG